MVPVSTTLQLRRPTTRSLLLEREYLIPHPDGYDHLDLDTVESVADR